MTVARRRVLVAVLCGVVATVAGIAIVVAKHDSPTGLLDLRIYLGAARAFRDGSSIYEYRDPSFGLGSTYPPMWSLVLVPMSALPVRTAELAWTWASELLWLAVIMTACPRRGDGRRAVPLEWLGAIWIATLFCAPIWESLNQGQVNILIWFLIVIDLRGLVDGRRIAGVATGVASAIKLTPLLVLVVVGAAGRLRFVAQGVLAFVGVNAAALLVAPSDSRRFWTDLLFDSSRVGQVDDRRNDSFAGLVARVHVEGTWRFALWVLVSIMVLTIGVIAVRRALSAGAVLTTAVVLGAVIGLVSPISWTHHLVAVPLVMVLVIGSMARLSTLVRLGALVGAVAASAALDLTETPVVTAIRTVGLFALVIGHQASIRAEKRLMEVRASEPAR